MEKHNKIQENFGKNASNYRYSTVHNDPVDLDRMIELLDPKSDNKILDVATGAGHTAIKLAGYAKKVVAIDITPEMLSEARKQSKEKNIDNIEFCVEDVHNMKFSDNTFDIVATRLAAHHFLNIEKALEEMCRVLKPGGKLYILDCSVADGDESEKMYNEIELLRDSSHVCSYSPRLWNKILKELPLKVQKTNFYKLQYELPRWFDRMGTTSKNRAEIFKILNALSEETKKEYSFSNNHITTYRIELLAKKI